MSEITERAGRKSRSEWVELMAAYEAGDFPQREFCERHAVAYSTFGYWRKQLRSPTLPVMPAAEPLVELSPFRLDDTMDWRVELELGCGLVLRLR
ncbi:MAG: hypothetical protein IIB74_05440 [Proteobacteria bacterium]|nr:hypothetical protein [Pseudomonadota bacterium]